MEPNNPPTLKQLKSIQKKLLQQIKEAQSLFSTDRNGHELLTSKVALKSIEELIVKAQKKEVA